MSKSVMDYVREQEKALSSVVHISHEEVDRIVLKRLISIRNSNVDRKNTDISYIDKTIKWFLTDDEFQKYVIDKTEIEY